MIQKIKSFIMISMMTLTMSVPALVPATALAEASGGGDCTAIGDKIAEGVTKASGTDTSCDGTDASTEGIGTLASNIVNVFSIIVGIVAVIMIIYGGFRYITSGGDSGSVGNAKNTLIYAIVGLIIVALAQLIVHFVLSSTSDLNQ